MNNKEALRRERILKGNLWVTILAICFPLMIYQAFNSWYTVIDQLICASISTTAQNAVASIAQIKNTISALGAGLAAGGGVLVARFFGAGDIHNARGTGSNLLLMSIILSLITAGVIIPLAYPILKICQIAPDSIAIGRPYFQLQMLELTFISINNVFIALEKARGRSHTILILNFIVMGIKIGLTCLFIYGFKFNDIIYVELATIIGQAVLTIVGLFMLFSKNSLIRLSIKLMKPRGKYVIPIIKLSVPIFLGKFVMNLGKVIVNAMCGFYWNDYTSDTVIGSLIVGTLGISNNMSGLITSPANSFEEGESSIVSQNVGNRNLKRALKIFVRTFVLATVFSLVGWVLMRFVFINPLTELFTLTNKAQDMEIFRNMVREIFKYDSLSIPALGIAAAVLGLLYGLGQTKLATVFNLSRIGSRIIILFVLHLTPLKDNPTLCAGLSMGISNIIIMVLSLAVLLGYLLHIKNHGFQGMYLTDPEPEVRKLVLDDDIKLDNDDKAPTLEKKPDPLEPEMNPDISDLKTSDSVQ